MAHPKRTVAQLADQHGIDRKKALRVAKQALPELKLRGADHALTFPQQQRVLDALGVAPEAEPVEPEPPAEPPKPPPVLVLDPPTPAAERVRPPLTHPIWLHANYETDVPAGTRQQLGKRVGIVVDQLAALGRTTVVKGCRGQGNKAWRRAPLGGNGGMQYYLWWAPLDRAGRAALGAPERAVAVRAIRHHDDHRPLALDAARTYLPIETGADLDDSLDHAPWTEAQEQAVRADVPVRLIAGRPGAGKTTVLQRLVDARATEGRTLYVTWSPSLVSAAEAHFKAFATEDPKKVVSKDLRGLMADLTGRTVPQHSATAAEAACREALAHLDRRDLGPWVDLRDALYAELRAHVLGGRTTPAAGPLAPDPLYAERRSGALAPPEVQGALDAFRHLGDRAPDLFPELYAAHEALQRLAADQLPEGFGGPEGFDRIVVDEVQDLTTLELACLVELALAIARSRERRVPRLAFAGDEGQTVRPSGFEWASLSRLITERIGPVEKFVLEENLRAPEGLAAVIARVEGLYGNLKKGDKPAKLKRADGGQHTTSRRLWADVPSVREANALVGRLLELDDVALVAADRPPAWLAPELAAQVLSPTQAKGLEWQQICVLGLGETLDRVEAGAHLSRPAELALRTRLDRLRVALSRSTETLAVLEIAPREQLRAEIEHLLGEPAPVDGADLLELLTDADASPEERLEARLQDARNLVDGNPYRAWLRAVQAVRLLGEAGRPGAIVDPQRRAEAHEVLVATALRLLLTQVPPGIEAEGVAAAGTVSIVALDEDHTALMDLALSWQIESDLDPFLLLKRAVRLQRPAWIQAFVPTRERLLLALDAQSQRAERAFYFVNEVEEWLRFLRFGGDAVTHARRLRCQAIDTLLALGEGYETAASLAERLDPPDWPRQARIEEGLGRFEEAARAFGKAGDDPGAVRCWRHAGRWAEAAAHAKAGSQEARDLRWLLQLDRLVDEQPAELGARLTAAERKRLKAQLARLGR